MACMCGDNCCPSCGPAQGNWRCPLCRQWASDGCDHIDDATGDLKLEYLAQASDACADDARIEAAAAVEEERYWREQELPSDYHGGEN